MSKTEKPTPADTPFWTEGQRKRLKLLWDQNLSIPNIAADLDKTYNQTEGMVRRMKKAGMIRARKNYPADRADAKATSIISREPPRFCPHREALMLKAVKAEGGFPLRRTIQLRGHLVAVLTTLDPHTPHPFQLAQFAKAAA